MSTFSPLIDGWRTNLNHALALMEDIPPQRMADQLGAVVNHPAWTMAHLNHYHPTILSLARGESVNDPGQAPGADRYDAGSTPINDVTAYPTKEQLILRFQQGHEQVEEVLCNAPSDLLERPPGLARWRDAFTNTGHVLAYLMLLHEAVHLGELIVWRRVAGLGPLADG